MNTIPDDFDRIYAEFGEKIYRFCLRLSQNVAEAEDLTQEVFVAALTGKDRFRGQSSLQTWLYRIALYKARDRRKKLRRETFLRDDIRATSPPLDVRIDLDAAIKDLSQKNREAFLLVKGERLTVPEAAQILGIPEGTVKYQVFEAVRQLRLALESQEQTPYAV